MVAALVAMVTRHQHLSSVDFGYVRLYTDLVQELVSSYVFGFMHTLCHV